MALLSDREAFDKEALKRAKFRIKADPYIRRIKNLNKKIYAENFATYLEQGGELPPELVLSYMASQGVRMELRELWEVA